VTEYLDDQGRVHRQSRDRDGHTLDVIVESERLQCSTCGWKTSSVVNTAAYRPYKCVCGGRLVRVG
jgi:hypothetical protein